MCPLLYQVHPFWSISFFIEEMFGSFKCESVSRLQRAKLMLLRKGQRSHSITLPIALVQHVVIHFIQQGLIDGIPLKYECDLFSFMGREKLRGLNRNFYNYLLEAQPVWVSNHPPGFFV